MLLTYRQAAEKLGYGTRSFYRIIAEYNIEVLRVRTGASKRPSPRIHIDEIERVIAQMRAEVNNNSRAGRDVPGENTCQKSAKVIAMDSSKGKARRAGTSRTQTPAAKELNDLLKL